MRHGKLNRNSHHNLLAYREVLFRELGINIDMVSEITSDLKRLKENQIIIATLIKSELNGIVGTLWVRLFALSLR